MLNLVMALHCHQPVGNFDHVFKMAMDKCYQPILEILYTHPSIRVGLHFSGPLLEWIEKNQPKNLDLITSLSERKQVEMLSGGFFEPLLATIPMKDARGQVLMMNEYLHDRFGSNPTGFWLTERVWDPGLPLVLDGTRMEYTIVDDTHFYYAGLKPDQIYGSYLTEKEGKTLNLFATPMVMRYIIPFKPVEEVINHLKAQEEMGRDLAIYGDDGEKFGLWPGTHDWVIKKGWLEKFFSAIENSGDWLTTTLPGAYLSSNKPIGRLYLPQASYEEMTEWAMPSERTHHLEEIIQTLKNENRWEDWRTFIRGGIWDNFLVKYDESNRMHKKMLFLSENIGRNEKAKMHLWRAQCNCAYWHGVFGGLYLGHLRRAIHENLIKAHECLINESRENIGMTSLDIDKDGRQEILIWNRKLMLGIAPAKGGGIFDISHLKTGINLGDTLTRRLEAYHYNISKDTPTNEHESDGISSIHDLSNSGDTDIEKLLIYDNYTRMSLLDHFIGNDVTYSDFADNRYSEEGNFIQKEYSLKDTKLTVQNAIIILNGKGLVGSSPFKVNKSITLTDNAAITIDYEFENLGKENLVTKYGCEFNLNLYSDQDPERYYYIPDTEQRREVKETGAEENVTRFEMINKADGLNVTFSFSSPVSVWFFPIMTVSKSESGIDYSYQGSALLFQLPFAIAPGKKEDLQIRMELYES